MNTQISIVRAIKPKAALGDPAQVLTTSEPFIVLGYIVGQATGIHTQKRTEPSGEVREWLGLRGDFEAIPVADDRPVQRAPVAYLPEHIFGMVQHALETADTKGVDFAFEVGARRVDRKQSPAGFMWEYTSCRDPEPSQDPLSHLRQLALERKGPPLLLTEGEPESEPEPKPKRAK
jgi:hypothetical protein